MTINGDDLDLPPLSLLRRYLTAHSWRQEPLALSGLDLFVYNDPEIGTVEIPLPQAADSTTVEARALQALRTLASVEQRAASQVLAEINALGYDVIQARLPTIKPWRGSISLRVAENFVRYSRRLLTKAASEEMSSRAIVTDIETESSHYADKCRFGHTFPSSFGLTIESPIGPHSEYMLSEVDNPPPFERRVVQRVARGLRIVSQAADQQDAKLIISNGATGFGERACGELIDLIEVTEADCISFGFIFSSEWKSPDDLASLSTIAMRPSAIPIIKDAISQLRVRPSVEIRRISGRVEGLASKNVPEDLFHPEGREITILWESVEYGDARVRVSLTPSDYLAAYQSHPTGRHVAVTGKLTRTARGLRMEDPRDFVVLD